MKFNQSIFPHMGKNNNRTFRLHNENSYSSAKLVFWSVHKITLDDYWLRNGLIFKNIGPGKCALKVKEK